VKKAPGGASSTADDPMQGDLFGGRPAPAPPLPSERVPVRPPAAPERLPVQPQGNRPPPVELREPLVAPPLAPAPGAVRKVVLTVGDLTRQIKGALEGEFPWVCVRGEVSGFRGANPRGHLYFSLKDREACLDVKIWATQAQRLKFKLRDGLEVVAEGSIDLYEPQGRYSLIVQRIDPAGEGALALAFQQLKERLMAEGLFGDRRKRPPRPLPFLPRRIGVVTSRSGAALRDFLRVLHQRNPRLSVLLCDARVQGEGSAFEVVRAIHRLARTDVDVIVVTRGGGSIEDLWTFNEERVARAIHGCPVPVVSAVGHEVDFTIADFVADYRAPTPSAAAEKLAPVLRDLQLSLRTAEGRLRKAAERSVLSGRERLGRLSRRLADPRRILGKKRLLLSDDTERMVRALRASLKARRELHRRLRERLGRQSPQVRLKRQIRQLADERASLRRAMVLQLRTRRQLYRRLRERLERAAPSKGIHDQRRRLDSFRARLDVFHRQLDERRHRFGELVAKLNALSPLDVLTRGYAVAFRPDGHVLREASEVRAGDELTLRLSRVRPQTVQDCDEILATVTSVKPR
jgi:exodeoxyribonuclease VII large subunit